MGFKEAASTVRAASYEADRRAYVERGRTERKHRRVGVRPAPDTMAVLTGYLPVEQGIACYAALQRSADTAVATGDSRTRDQIMADTLVERLTGQAAAGDLNIELQLMMPLDALIKPDDQSAAVTGSQTGAARLLAATPPGATTTAGWPNSSAYATKTAATRSVTPHKIIITTPTGHHYLSRAPDPP